MQKRNVRFKDYLGEHLNEQCDAQDQQQALAVGGGESLQKGAGLEPLGEEELARREELARDELGELFFEKDDSDEIRAQKLRLLAQYNAVIDTTLEAELGQLDEVGAAAPAAVALTDTLTTVGALASTVGRWEQAERVPRARRRRHHLALLRATTVLVDIALALARGLFGYCCCSAVDITTIIAPSAASAAAVPPPPAGSSGCDGCGYSRCGADASADVAGCCCCSCCSCCCCCASLSL